MKDIPFSSEYLELTFDEVPENDIYDIMQDMWSDESIRQLIYDSNEFAYNELMKDLDEFRNPSSVTIEIPWQSNSQGPYVRGDVKVSFDEYPSIKMHVDGVEGDVTVEIADLYCNGYDVSNDDVTVEIDYKTSGNEDLYYDDVYDAVIDSSECKNMIDNFVKNVNDYLDEKWDIINKYNRDELQPFDEEFLKFECDANGLVFLYAYDEEGNPTEYVGFKCELPTR